jgi:hypothetical protein
MLMELTDEVKDTHADFGEDTCSEDQYAEGSLRLVQTRELTSRAAFLKLQLKNQETRLRRLIGVDEDKRVEMQIEDMKLKIEEIIVSLKPKMERMAVLMDELKRRVEMKHHTDIADIIAKNEELIEEKKANTSTQMPMDTKRHLINTEGFGYVDTKRYLIDTTGYGYVDSSTRRNHHVARAEDQQS